MNSVAIWTRYVVFPSLIVKCLTTNATSVNPTGFLKGGLNLVGKQNILKMFILERSMAFKRRSVFFSRCNIGVDYTYPISFLSGSAFFVNESHCFFCSFPLTSWDGDKKIWLPVLTSRHVTLETFLMQMLP